MAAGQMMLTSTVTVMFALSTFSMWTAATGFVICNPGEKSAQSADAALADVLKKAGLDREDISLIVSTGYGRVSIPFADKNVTEISCHGKGAHLLFPDVHTILDIGGQDSKAIRLNDNGEVADFVMNDKCAAVCCRHQ